MRWWLVLAAAGCGRIGFGADAVLDGAQGDARDARDPLELPGLVVRYPMDDAPLGGIVPSPQLPASCTACPASTAGVIGGGYLFDGTTTFFTVPSTTLLGAAPYSIAVWFRLDQMPQVFGGRTITNKPLDGASTFNAVNLLVHDPLRLSYETTPTGQYADYNQFPTDVVLGQWHHAVATWSGSDKKIYQDGVLGTTENAVTMLDSAQNVLVGADNDGSGVVYGFAGALDELQYYNRPLTDAEVARLAADR